MRPPEANQLLQEPCDTFAGKVRTTDMQKTAQIFRERAIRAHENVRNRLRDRVQFGKPIVSVKLMQDPPRTTAREDRGFAVRDCSEGATNQFRVARVVL